LAHSQCVDVVRCPVDINRRAIVQCDFLIIDTDAGETQDYAGDSRAAYTSIRRPWGRSTRTADAAIRTP
jgi:hypothetical protein